MKKNILYIFSLLIIPASVFTGCKKKDNDDNNNNTGLTGTNAIRMEFTHKVGSQLLALNTGNYTNANGDQYTVSRFRYYLSNFRFRKTDGTYYTVPSDVNSDFGYFLIDEGNADSKNISIPNIPAGDYDAVEFLIGVDSLRNTTGAQTGSLDPANGMFWSWNSGYIFVMFEGNSPQSTAANNALVLHTGGFKQPANNIKKVTLTFNGSVAKVRSNISPEIHLIVDVNEIFANPNTISFATLNTAHMPMATIPLAQNYADMIRVDHIHND
jgi:hypothetical protein